MILKWTRKKTDERGYMNRKNECSSLHTIWIDKKTDTLDGTCLDGYAFSGIPLMVDAHSVRSDDRHGARLRVCSLVDKTSFYTDTLFCRNTFFRIACHVLWRVHPPKKIINPYPFFSPKSKARFFLKNMSSIIGSKKYTYLKTVFQNAVALLRPSARG